MDIRKEITQLKKNDLVWLNEVSNNVAKQAVKDCCEAYKKFFKKQSKFPKFKSKRKTIPSFYNDNYKLKIKEKLVLIEKVGWIKTSEQVSMDTKYYNPRIKFDGKHWYLTVGIEREKPNHELTNESIGIDLGIKNLAIISNGKVFKNINKQSRIKKLTKSLKRKQRQVSRKYNIRGEKPLRKSANTLKLERQIKLIYRTITNIRDNHIHQITSEIVKTKPSRVVMEDLNISGMIKNRHLSKAISNQKFHFFIKTMKYKCEFNGIEFVLANRFFPSSKTCSQCGTIKKDLKLSDRLYKCDCGLEIDRDLNASINLSNYKVS